MTAMLLLHGTFVDEFIELGLPLLIFGALYWWSTRKERRRKKRNVAKANDKTADAAAGRGENA